MPLNLDFDKLRSFVAVAEELHFTKAAQNRLHVSQPWLSKSVKDLEEQLGVPLLHRHSRHVELTREGRRFVYALRGIVYSFDRAVSAIPRETKGKQNFKIVYSAYVDLRFIAELKQFEEKVLYPMTISFNGCTSEDAVAKVERYEQDLAIVTLPLETSKVEIVQLFREPLAAAVGKSHPLAKRRSLRLEDLGEQKLILPHRGSHCTLFKWLIQRFSEAGTKPNIVDEASGPQEGQYLVSRGAGIALANAGAFCTPVEGVVVRPIVSEGLQIDTALVLRREKCCGPAAAYIARVQELAKVRRRNRLPPLPLAG